MNKSFKHVQPPHNYLHSGFYLYLYYLQPCLITGPNAFPAVLNARSTNPSFVVPALSLPAPGIAFDSEVADCDSSAFG